MKVFSLLAGLSLITGMTHALVQRYGQCCGTGYTGQTECVPPYVCVVITSDLLQVPTYCRCDRYTPGVSTVPPSRMATVSTAPSTTPTPTATASTEDVEATTYLATSSATTTTTII